jgi:hypothetical protein
MGTSFLNLTNRVLRKINEVELTDTNFMSAKGMQALVKDSVLDAVSEINQQKWEWPFYAIENTMSLVVGENEYGWPSDYKMADWDSFQIQKDGTYSTVSSSLTSIDKDRWYKYLKDRDDNSGDLGISVPTYVFNTHGYGFGVSPTPDKPYLISYRYWRNPVLMVNSSDVCDIPSDYDNIIVTGALYHMNIFRENVNGTNIAENKFKEAIKNMYNASAVKPDRIDDTMVNFSGIPRKTTFGGSYV